MVNKGKNITTSAEEMRQKLFGNSAESVAQKPPSPGDRFKAYLEYIGKTVTVPLEHITIEDNVRKQVDVTSPKFIELVESIRREGLLQNLIVDVRQTEEGTYLSCVSGQRRLLAARQAGVEKAVCLLKQYSEGQRITIGLTENLIRQDLHCVDVADGYAELKKNGWSEEEIADRFERGQRTVHRYLLIAAWPDDVKAKIRANPQVFSTRTIFNQFVSRSFASDEALREAIDAKIQAQIDSANNAIPDKKAKSPAIPIQTRQTVQVLTDKLQTGVAVKDKGGSGKIEIAYLDQTDLDRILSLLTLA